MFAVAHATPEGSREQIAAELVRKVADVLHSRHADTLDTVLRIAGISQSRVAAAFDHGGALFIAVVTTVADRMLAPLAERPTIASFHPQLVAFARQATEGFSGRQLGNLYRIAVANEFGGHAVRAEGFGPDMDCRRAAVHFLSLLRTYWDIADVSANPAHIDDDLDWMVEVFLSGIQARSNDAFPTRPAQD